MTIQQKYQLDLIMAEALNKMINVLQWGGVSEKEALCALHWYLSHTTQRVYEEYMGKESKKP